MEAFIAIGLVAAILFLLFVRGRWTPTKSWHEHFGGIESLLAILAIAGAASWYFVARPDAAKIVVDQDVAAFRLNRHEVIVLTEVRVSNVGARSLKLEGERYRYYLQQVYPIVPLVDEERLKRNEDTSLVITPGDKWQHLARAEGVVKSNIEAGEVENLYFRVIIPCRSGLILYSTIWMDRPASLIDKMRYQLGLRKMNPVGELQWIKQVPLDLAEQCNPKGNRK